MAHAGVYVVLIPFQVDGTKDSHKEVESIAKTLLLRLKRNKERNVYPQVVSIGGAGKNSPGSIQWADDSVVYVTCHGNQKVIGPMTNDINLTPELLANDLAGVLPDTLQHLKIMTCHSGSGYVEENAYVNQLCQFLYKKNFHNLTVYGYCGYTGEPEKKPKHSYVTVEQGKGRPYNASGARIAVSGEQGKVQSIPTLKIFREEVD